MSRPLPTDQPAADPNQARLTAILENTSDLVSTATPDQRVLYLNRAGRTLAGLGLEESLAELRIGDFHPGWVLEKIEREALPAALATGHWEGETMLRRRDGREIPVSQVILAHHSPGGAVEYFSTIMRDISRQKQAEQSLRESRERLASVFRAAPTGIGLVVNRTLMEVNARICEMTGYRSEELAGQSARLLYLSDEDFEFVGQEKYRQIAAGGTGTVETRWRRKDGRVIEVLLSSSPLDLKDLSRGVTFTALDITERKAAEKEKERLQAQLLQAHKMESVGRLAGGVAHDFNNMLLAILGNAALALDEIPPGSSLREYLEEIQKSAQRSADLTRQLLAFARQQTIQPRLLNLNETVAGMLKMLRRVIGENIELDWIAGPDLWPVKMDPVQVDQLLANLGVNARDAIAGNGRLTIATANVTLAAADLRGLGDAAPGDYVRLSVSDTGHGMDEATRAHLFEPFFTTKPLGQGTGLGLATVFGIVKQNHGFIHVESAPGRGTTFHLHLPRTAAAAPVAAAPRPQPLPGGTETLLLVEDEAQILALGKRFLELHGYTVLAASSPAAALELVARHGAPVQLLITDVVMPGMNGKELWARLRAANPTLRCLFISGYTANVIAHHGVLDDAVEFLQKPFATKALAERVRRLLDAGSGKNTG